MLNRMKDGNCYIVSTIQSRRNINMGIVGICKKILLADTYITPPRPSEISEENWSTFLTSHLWCKAMLKVWKNSWEPFRIYQLTSTANPSQFHKLWLNWLQFFSLISESLGCVVTYGGEFSQVGTLLQLFHLIIKK